MTKFLSVLVTLAMLVAVPRASASARESLALLDGQVTLLEADGFECSASVFGMELGNRQVEDLAIYLRSGMEYAIVGAGDSTTLDLDLALYDRHRRFVAGDHLSDARPSLIARPPASGQHKVRLTMAAGAGHAYFAVCFRAITRVHAGEAK